MAMNFPASPLVGDRYPTTALPGLPQYTWDGTVWTSGTIDTSYVKKSGDAMTGSLTPAVNGAVNLGSALLRWGTVFTSDLSLSNGVGDWTVVEGENDLFLYNNKKGQTYKFALIKVDPSTAPRKKV
jgi:hypothetical protein